MSFFEDRIDYGVIDVLPSIKYIPCAVPRDQYTDYTLTLCGDATTNANSRRATTLCHRCLANPTQSISTNNPISVGTGRQSGSLAKSNSTSIASGKGDSFDDDM